MYCNQIRVIHRPSIFVRPSIFYGLYSYCFWVCLLTVSAGTDTYTLQYYVWLLLVMCCNDQLFAYLSIYVYVGFVLSFS